MKQLIKTRDNIPAKQQNKSSKMEKLLNQKIAPKLPTEGDVIIGKVIDIGSNSIYLDLGALGTGVILGQERYDGLNTIENLCVGDKLSATVIKAENEDGYTELSLREAGQEKSWENLQEKFTKQKTLTVKILNANSGGLITELNGITAFLPVSQLSMKHYPRVGKENRNQILNKLKTYIDKKFKVKIIDLNQEQNKLIVSEKEAARKKREKLISQLEIGQTVSGQISGVADFGVFVKFTPEKDSKEKLEGLVHISELAWQRIEDPRNLIKKGDIVKAKIINIKDDRIALSIRQLKKDPWKQVEEKYEIGQEIQGKVSKIDHYGAFVQLDNQIQGLAHISQFKGQIPLKEGQTYTFKITSLEPKKHRLQLDYIKIKNKKYATKTVSKTTKKKKKTKK